MTESTAVQEIEDGAAVEAIEDGAAVGALKLAAIQRMYEEAKTRITDLPDSCSEPAPNVTDPRPQPGHNQGAALVAALAASKSVNPRLVLEEDQVEAVRLFAPAE